MNLKRARYGIEAVLTTIERKLQALPPGDLSDEFRVLRKLLELADSVEEQSLEEVRALQVYVGEQAGWLWKTIHGAASDLIWVLENPDTSSMLPELEAQVAILEEYIDPDTQEAMDHFYAAYKRTRYLPNHPVVLPRLLQLLKKECREADSDTMKMDIIEYILEFDDAEVMRLIAADAASLLQSAHEWSIYLFLGVLYFADQRAVMKDIYPQQSSANQAAIRQILNDIIFRKEFGADYSPEKQIEMSQVVREVTGEI